MQFFSWKIVWICWPLGFSHLKTWTPERHGSFKVREKIAQIRSLSGQPQNHNNIFWHHKLPPLSTSRLGCCLPLMFFESYVPWWSSFCVRQQRRTELLFVPVLLGTNQSTPCPILQQWLQVTFDGWLSFLGGCALKAGRYQGMGWICKNFENGNSYWKGDDMCVFFVGVAEFWGDQNQNLEFGRKLTGNGLKKRPALDFKNDMNPEMIKSTRVCRVLKSCGWTLRYWASTPVVGPFHLAGGAIRVAWVPQIVQELMPLLSTKFSKPESGPVPAINGSDPMRLVTTASLKLAAPSMWCATCRWGWALQIQSRIKQPNLTKPTSPCIIRGALVDGSNMRSCPFLICFTFVEKLPGVRTGGFWISRLDHNWCDNGCAHPPIPPINQSTNDPLSGTSSGALCSKLSKPTYWTHVAVLQEPGINIWMCRWSLPWSPARSFMITVVGLGETIPIKVFLAVGWCSSVESQNSLSEKQTNTEKKRCGWWTKNQLASWDRQQKCLTKL